MVHVTPALACFLLPFLVESDECEDCTPDEFAAIIRELRDKSGLIGNHSYHLITYRNCFIGKDFVTWLMKYKGYAST